MTTTPVIRSRRVLAAAMTTAPILLLAGTAVLPAAIGEQHGTDRARPLQVLQDVPPGRGRLPIGLVLIVLGLGLLVAAAAGLVWLARGSRPALIGAALVAVAAP